MFIFTKVQLLQEFEAFFEHWCLLYLGHIILSKTLRPVGERILQLEMLSGQELSGNIKISSPMMTHTRH